MIATELLVVGAGPYALSTAGLARERGIKTVVVGRPMEFWRENMPEGMFLRSGPDWHMDGAGTHTVAAFLEDGKPARLGQHIGESVRRISPPPHRD